MSLKRFIRFGFLLVLVSLAFGITNAQADSSVIGPYTEILIPFEELPALNEDLAYHPVIDQYKSEATLQVLYVLEDPRDVPLARYVYYKDDYGVIAPNNIPTQWSEYSTELEEVKSFSPKTINVYVRVQAPADQQVPDPLFAGGDPGEAGEGFFYSSRYNGDRPTLFIPYYSLNKELYEGFPCAVPEYADGTQPYQIPEEINGGLAIGKNGLYDPAAYAPPQPWYFNENKMLEAGEVREGWVSCLAPGVPLDEIRIETWYEYVMEEQPVNTPAPSPAPIEGGGIEIECLIVESLDDPACSEDTCCTLALPTANAPDQSNIDNQAIIDNKALDVFTAWSYNNALPFPKEGIRLEGVKMSFINEAGEIKNAQGSAVFESANVIQVERSGPDYVPFISKVHVDPEVFSEEDLKGYILHRVDVSVEIYEQSNSIYQLLSARPIQNIDNDTYEKFLLANSKHSASNEFPNETQVLVSMFLDEPDSPYEGCVLTDLVIGSVPYGFTGGDNPLSERDNRESGPLPTKLWFSINPSVPVDTYSGHVEAMRNPRYSVIGATINNTDFTSMTNMCEVVDCVEYLDEGDTYRAGGYTDPKVIKIKPSRSIPVMCAGEWANNIIVDDLTVIKYMEYIREPWGDGREGGVLHRDDINYGGAAPVFLYDLRIMGGGTPWWIKTKMSGNSRSYDPLDYIYGHTVDLNTGWPVHNDAAVIPYYAVIENDLSKGFLARGTSYPVNFYSEKSGWMGEIIDQKVLAFSSVNIFDDGEDYKSLNNERTGFLFLDEGPLWVTDCPRDLMPASSSKDRYAPEEVVFASIADSSPHAMNSLLPGMTYPTNLPVVDGKFYSLGEYGDTYTFESSDSINNYKFTVSDVELVRGKADRSAVYVPTEDTFYPAEKYPNWNNRQFFARNSAFVIPPDTTYVEITVGVDRLEISEGFHCELEDEDLQLVYPGYLPINGVIETKPDEPKICKKDDSSFRIAFLFPSLDFELEKMLFSIRGGAQLPWNFWRLTE